MRRSAELDRRLVRLRWLVMVAGAVLAARLVQVQVVEHDRFLAAAHRQWERRITLPSHRGEIRDRRGRVLALSTRHWQVGVATRSLDAAAREEAATVLAEVLDLPRPTVLRRLADAGGRHVVLARRACLDDARVRRLRRVPGISLDPLETRTYPYGGLAASLLGTYHRDPDGRRRATALELGLDDLLEGAPGVGLRANTGIPGRDAGVSVIEPPRDGHDVTLTLDIDLQRIAEECLARSVAECAARGGSVLILDPADGAVLAAADTPLVTDRRRVTDPAAWNNGNFTTAYEPGSVFKIFTTAALLQAAAIDTGTVIDCAATRFDGYTIRNDAGHDFGRMALLDAFAHSSNVYFARAVLNLSPEEFYRSLTAFGFGMPLEVPYPATSRGSLRPPAAWSRRSQSTLAIGQELAATPLQLVLAAAAVANGGTVPAPRLVAAVDGTPLPAAGGGRRVLEPAVTALVRRAMREVVVRGTGRAAAVAWTTTAGKTGTAQVPDLENGGYRRGAYIASFLGFVPAEAPRLVILTVLDEPDRRHHYAAQSAAPLFRAVVEEIGRSTDWLRDATTRITLPGPAAGVPVPDLLYLDTATAERVLAGAGLAARADAVAGTVVGQVPPPGTRLTPGETVTLVVASGGAARPDRCPDWRGLSSRDVNRRAARLGLAVRCRGVGYVTAQDPPPGAPLPEGPIELVLEMP